MTLDEILKEHSAWLDKTAKQPLFGRVTERETNFPQELRDQRAKEIKAAIEALTQRRDETVSLYESAIEGYKKELEALTSAPGIKPPTAKSRAAKSEASTPEAKPQTEKPAASTKAKRAPTRSRAKKK
ncbi:hypothetical protein [Mesorhizobium sp. L-8-3]|uniref:hypothetical protein n=1 Tax=Mesorhizobium sp. L-8-3 TaxID=2744522 RepID=UPI0019266538|nr:hypothetical protein [Mesorhizobium sp. L-8-3]BCH26311.1 hypothetical protein MesoLjLb_60960 [Mesorhizobium sp. L-8-3]